ncbi:MAG: hypothetical protein HWE25_05565 [Alphaproteobacteria bacterium]|nr:hypothetical protein [Alphaproteobacteria bacterium]
MTEKMTHTIDNDGLHRLVAFELKKLHPKSRQEAVDKMMGRMGAYDVQGFVIKEGVDAYFANSLSAA